MPKTMRYGLIIIALGAILCLSAYTFRKQIHTFFNGIYEKEFLQESVSEETGETNVNTPF